jgi:hypothetical protein
MQVPILYVIIYDTTLLSALFDYVCVTLTTSMKCRLYQRPILKHSQMLFTLNPYLRVLPVQVTRQEVLRLPPYTTLQPRIPSICHPSHHLLRPFVPI